MAVLPTGIGPVTGYNIERSLRFNSADSAYLNRTFAASSGTTDTFSFWVKRSKLGSAQSIFDTSNGVNTSFGIFFTSSDALEFYDYVSGYRMRLVTTQVFRDTSAWYHIVCYLNTTNATASNRAKIYVNGVEVTAFSTATYPTQNFSLLIGTSKVWGIGATGSIGGQYLNGYLTEFNFIDGQALTPSDFGETDSNTGVWKPKAYTGTYGTNGFFLKFADNSNTTAATLGKDSSGNGNNWTPNNFSVTAGAGNDSLVDSPTSYGTDTGVGGEVRGNYGTWNPLRPNAAMSYANGNLDATSNGGSGRSGYGTFGMSSGKWYFETTGGDNSVGVATVDESVYAVYTAAGGYNINGTTTSGKATYTTSDVISCAYDADANTIEFFKNGASQGSTSFSAAAGLSVVAQFSGTFSVTRTCVANFGQRAFAYTAPSGFKALCTQNLPPVTIGATSTTQANDYMNVVTYTGNGTTTGNTQSITGVGFQPDFTWIKSRSAGTQWHLLNDAIRGTNKLLYSNDTAAEASVTNVFNSFNANGFTVAYNSAYTSAQSNANGSTYVAWNWNAGGSNQTISVGQYSTSPNVPSIASTVRANTTSGFSIVTYTGNNTASTVGHGLGVAPSMIIVKNRDQAIAGGDTQNWFVYHSSIGATGQLTLNTTGTVVTNAEYWNNTAPTGTVFSLGNGNRTNFTGDDYVAYCFASVAGYSAFGSYTGNNSATDGTFVYLGFRPRFLMIKSTSAGTSWVMMDSARNTYNLADTSLYAESANSEATIGTVNDIDFLSNGFKLRNNTGFVNASQTYIYAAFAETPAKFSLAR